MDFRWIPREGPSEAARERLKAHFPKPENPPPEAWFMSGEIHYLTGLAETPLSEIPSSLLEAVLSDLGGGIKNFGRRQEWVDWFHYLLPDVVLRAHEDDLLGVLVMYFVNLYPSEIEELYDGFRDDVLNTLGKAIMSPVFWDEDDLYDEMLHNERPCRIIYDEEDFVVVFSPAMLFGLKYLSPDEITSWVASMKAIAGSYWHHNLMFWLYHAASTIEYWGTRQNQDTVSANEYFTSSKLDWPEFGCMAEFSHDYDLISQANMDAFKAALKANRLFYD